MHKDIFKNTSFQVVSRVVTTIIGFLITIIIARHFGAYDFGEFSKITSYIAMFYLFVDFGLNAIFLKNPKSFSSLFYLRIILSILVLVFANIIAFVLPYNSNFDTGFSPFVRMGIFIFSFTIFSQAIIYSASSIFQKNLKYHLLMYSQIIGEIISLFIIVLLIFFAKSLPLIIFAFVISNFITAALSIFLTKENINEFDSSYSKQMIISSAPLGLMLIFNLIYFRIDILILSFFKSNQDVGLYSIAYRFFDFFIAIPLFLSNSLYPKLIENLKSSTIFTKIANRYLLVYLILSIVIVIPVWFLSPMFKLVGDSYSLASIPFRILILSLPVFFLTSFVQWVLISLNQQKFLLIIYFVAALLNIILNLIFIPQYSYFASAWITGGCELFVLIALLLKFKSIKISSNET